MSLYIATKFGLGRVGVGAVGIGKPSDVEVGVVDQRPPPRSMRASLADMETTSVSAQAHAASKKYVFIEISPRGTFLFICKHAPRELRTAGYCLLIAPGKMIICLPLRKVKESDGIGWKPASTIDF